ncbi:MAG: PD40 domain-containing protein [Candidatus Fermentithermobacillus carboniphilus]|uniref:PD40 domain-containing protein n=1 Tax=Candidatus Fermentithermobacillus carboniphilus TaxID=3085328 RepID=A0AAT9LAP9_9FIRM|nr:MAG: PD40 domain-containing protein [Candidatus Fermentithermobacillus carboniphilus]
MVERWYWNMSGLFKRQVNRGPIRKMMPNKGAFIKWLSFKGLPGKGLTARVLATVILIAGVISGCARPFWKTSRTLSPHVLSSFEVSGGYWISSPDSSISPDGKKMVIVKGDSKRYELVVMALEGSGPNMAVVDSVDRQWTADNFFAYVPLAWASDSRLIYARHGWQKDGAHAGKRGLSIVAANIADKSTEEIYFVELPQGCYLRDQAFIPGKGKIYMTLSQTTGNSIWEIDVKTGKMRLVKDGLPVYGDLFQAKISPDGSHYVYSLYEEGRAGIYILDVATGEERPLLPSGDTMSFYPSWSPDGRYVAAYTVERVPGASGTSIPSYQLFPAEDGPLPLSTSITVVDKQGKLVQEIRVDGRLLADFQWAKGSPAIGFVAGIVDKDSSSSDETYPGYPPAIIRDSLWLVTVDGKSAPVKIADVPKDGSGGQVYVDPVAVDVKGEGVFYNLYVSQERSLWYAAKGKEPVKVADGSMTSGDTTPVYGNALVGAATLGDKTVIWLLQPGKFQKLAEYDGAYIAGFNDTLMVVSTLGYDLSQQAKGKVTVFKMFK